MFSIGSQLSSFESAALECAECQLQPYSADSNTCPSYQVTKAVQTCFCSIGIAQSYFAPCLATAGLVCLCWCDTANVGSDQVHICVCVCVCVCVCILYVCVCV
eukprot:scpid20430/ scgid9760/ 